jgi:hypothetical protein
VGEEQDVGFTPVFLRGRVCYVAVWVEMKFTLEGFPVLQEGRY